MLVEVVTAGGRLRNLSATTRHKSSSLDVPCNSGERALFRLVFLLIPTSRQSDSVQSLSDVTPAERDVILAV